MTTFHQEKQTVHGNQTNIGTLNQVNTESAGDISFDSVANSVEFIVELHKLLEELNKAVQTGNIRKGIAIDVESHIKKVIVEVEEEPKPKKNTILDHFDKAKKLLDGIPAVTGLVTALLKAAEFAGRFFL